MGSRKVGVIMTGGVVYGCMRSKTRGSTESVEREIVRK